MHHGILRSAVLAAVLAFTAHVSFAADTTTSKSGEAAAKPKTSQKSAKAKKPKPPRLVDINSANKAQLKTLPGVGDAEADKIVGGRPYHTKAELVTRNILPSGVYEGLKRQIVALQKRQR